MDSLSNWPSVVNHSPRAGELSEHWAYAWLYSSCETCFKPAINTCLYYGLAGSVRSAINHRNCYLSKGWGWWKQRTSHPAQHCPLVEAIDTLSCWEIKSISGIMPVFTAGFTGCLIKCLYFVIYNLTLYCQCNIT